MRKHGKIKRIIAYLLSICLFVSGLCITDYSTVEAADSTTVYFYNDAGWTTVNAYAYDSTKKLTDSDLLGGWPGTAATSAGELGANWWKVDVPVDVASIAVNIMFNNGNSEKTDIYISNRTNVYTNRSCTTAYATATEAGVVTGSGAQDGGGQTTIYFYNNKGWTTVNAYAYDSTQRLTDANLLGGWPGTVATSAGELGANWWKVDVPVDVASTAVNIMFNDGNNGKTDVYIQDRANVYTNASSNTAYSSSNDAANAVGGNEGSGNGEGGSESGGENTSGSTIVYFYNNHNWSTVNAHAYYADGTTDVSIFGDWPGPTATNKGNGWWQIEVPRNVAAGDDFKIIFNNGNNGEQTNPISIVDNVNVYTNADNTVFDSTTKIEISSGAGATDANSTTIYFKNSKGWKNVSAYVYKDDKSFGASWPGTPAMKATEVGTDWWKVIVPIVATEENSFGIIFNDGMNKTPDMEIKDGKNVYTTPAGGTYATVEEVDVATKDDIPIGEGSENAEPNADLTQYDVVLSGTGANLPYTTYEAETAATNATVLDKKFDYLTMQSEASGRQAVKLVDTNDYVEFTLTKPANAFVIRYSMPDSVDGVGVNASLSMYADGEETDLALTSKYAWVYGKYPYSNEPSQGEPHRFFDETRGFFGKTLPTGTKIKLQKNAEDTAEYYVIDFIECEMVDEAGTQPQNSLSITEYGAKANDGNDDAAAINACIKAAKEQGKEVWIPAGTFDVTTKTPFVVKDVTIRGAGMWYSNLKGAGASFHYSGTSRFFDLAMTGVADIRKDAEDLAGFEGEGEALNVTIQNIWMEHMKVGVWSYNSTNLVIQGCRIRNTYADGINMSSNTVNAVVQNNNVRNTGDDGIACWPASYNCTGNTVKYNTVQFPTLANGIIFYGGGGHTAEWNYVADIVVNGAGIGISSQFPTSDGYTGKVTIKNNELHRCGSMQKDYGYPVGAIWLWSTNGAMTTQYDITNNKLYDCSYEAFLFDCYNSLTGATIKDNYIYSANTDGILVRGETASGSATIENNIVEELGGELIVNNIPNLFALNLVGEGIFKGKIPEETKDPTVLVTGVTLSQTALALKVGENATLTVTIAPDTATNKEVEWTTSDPTVVTVENGVVTAANAGTAKVYVTTLDGSKKAECEVIVTEKIQTEDSGKDEGGNVDDGKDDGNSSTGDNTPGTEDDDKDVSDEGGSVDDGKDDGNSSTGDNTPGTEDNDKDVSDEGGSVDDGKDNGDSSAGDNTPGTEDNDKDVSDESGSVDDGKDDGNSSAGDNTPGTEDNDKDVSDEGGSVDDGKDNGDSSTGDNTPGTGDHDENVSDEGGSGDDKTPPVSDKDITLNEGQKPGTGNEGTQKPGAGSTTQTESENKQSNQEVKVTDIKITGISKKIAYNKSIKLSANVTPAEASNKAVKWEVNDKKYASVTQNGVVKFKKAAIGKTVTVTATATDGSDIKANYEITVMKKAVSKIKLKATTSVKAGKSIKVKATVTPAKDVNKELNWTSSNTKYATVNKKGVVKTKKAGKGKIVKITAKATDGSNKKATIKIKIK